MPWIDDYTAFHSNFVSNSSDFSISTLKARHSAQSMIR